MFGATRSATALVVAAFVGWITLGPARARCHGSVLFGQGGTAPLGYSYVVTPGRGELDRSLLGRWWAVGHGSDHHHGEHGASAWLVPYQGRHYLVGDWAMPGVQGCIDELGPPGEVPMAVLVADEGPEGRVGYFAVATVSGEWDAFHLAYDFAFVRPGPPTDVTLRPLPAVDEPRCAVATSPDRVRVDVRWPGAEPGLYADRDVTFSELGGTYRLYYRWGADDPDSRGPLSGGEPASSWSAAPDLDRTTDGTGASTDTQARVDLPVPESSTSELWLAVGLELEGEFATHIVGASTRIASPPVELDVDGDGIPDDRDVCPCTPDPLQQDLDADGYGDACDPDQLCGDGRLDVGEVCDDGNRDPGDGCGPTCREESCGNGVVDPGEECDDGDLDPDDGCSELCRSEECGDGSLDADEECDDGNLGAGDGCGVLCRFEACGNGLLDLGETCDDGNQLDGDSCPADCGTCGNGRLDGDEECDDGERAPGDGCSAACRFEVCGDGFVDPDEECDDGNLDADDGCGPECRLELCGDGVRQAGEECDDGNTQYGDGCTPGCLAELCGNGRIDTFEECDDGDLTNGDGCSEECRIEECGNGHVDPLEECDDGGNEPIDGCSPDCELEPCGNGVLEGDEECDDGGYEVGDGCGVTCLVERCGNAYLDPGEECDDGDAANGPGCGEDCRFVVCGDGILHAVEECDDGDLVSGDGCGPSCLVERCGNGLVDPGEECDGGPDATQRGCDPECTSSCGNGRLDAGESCDDGNRIDGDGCGRTCRPDACGERRPGLRVAQPYPMAGHVAVYDTRRSVHVLFDLEWDGTVRVWEWSGTSWEGRAVGRFESLGELAAAFDVDRGVSVVYGVPEDPRARPDFTTWEWDGELWRSVSTDRLEGTTAVAMAYDAARMETVLFDGSGAATWTWDGDVWQKVSTSGPPSRSRHAMTYDARRREVLLVAGLDASRAHRDTWSWNGSEWRQESDLPARLYDSGLTYDSDRGVAVLMGGTATALFLFYPVRSIVEWNGSLWTELDAPYGPGPRTGHSFTYDPVRRVSVQVGAMDSGHDVGDFQWEWDGTDWSRVELGLVSPVSDGTVVYDETRRTLYLVGLGTTREWRDSKWVELPDTWFRGRAVYDSRRGVLVGLDGDRGETWEFDGTWRELDVEGPPWRDDDFAMAFDRRRGVTVLFGGEREEPGEPNPERGTTWEFDGRMWRAVSTTGPLPRKGHSLTYDERRERTVLYGGSHYDEFLDATWEWDGIQWVARDRNGLPGPRELHGATYDVGSGLVVISGGRGPSGVLDDLWAWDGTRWKPHVAPTTGPRMEHLMGYDRSEHRIVVYGGHPGTTRVSDEYTDTLFFDLAAPPPRLELRNEVELAWSSPGESTSFDLVVGSLAALREPGGGLEVAVEACLASRAETFGWTDQTLPSPTAPPFGDGLFYLVRENDSERDPGSFDASCTQPSRPRDDAIAASPYACPD